MKYKDFKKLLVEKNISKSFLFTGQEGLLIERTIEYIVSNFISKSFLELNYSHLHGSNLSFNEFFSSMETLPLMSDKRVIIVDELNDLNQKIDFNDEMLKDLDNIYDDIVVIFHDSEFNLKKTTKLYKYFKKNQRVVEFDKLNNYELTSFIKKEFKKKNKKILDSDLSYFIMLTGYNNKKLEVTLYDVLSNIEKLSSYTLDGYVTKSDIDKVVKRAVDSNIFNLLDSLGNKNPQKSLEIIHDLYDNNEPLVSILHMIQRRFRHLYKYLSLYDINKMENEIKKIIDISDYEFKVVSNTARRLNLCDVKENLDDIFQVEKKFKSSSQDGLMLMEYLVVKICK